MHQKPTRIIIVGGGAGGLELATRLGHRLGKTHQAEVILVDEELTHIWKPLLHEIAAGTLNSYEDELNFFTLAHQHYFHFELGRLIRLNRHNKTIHIATQFSNASQATLARELAYDILILALGSISNDFNVPGVQEHCFILDSRQQAELFHQSHLMYFLKAQAETHPILEIAIIGGGATGVELAAELHYAINLFSHYGLNKLQTKGEIHISLIESGPRILAQLPLYISKNITESLQAKGIRILTDQRVAKITANGIETQDGQFVPAQLKVWAAGIKGDPFLTQLDGLTTNKLNQLLVKNTLQTTLDDHIFAFGDCAACPQPHSDRPVPPRAQAASQEASLLAESIPQWLKGKPLLSFRYQDYGSLITLSQYTAVGQLMMARGFNLGIQGRLARWLYIMLYKRHQIKVLGLWRTITLTFANLLSGGHKARLKLH